MKFTEIELTNWAVYRETSTIQFDSTSEKPIILINADNDKGKTSLFYSIRKVVKRKAYHVYHL